MCAINELRDKCRTCRFLALNEGNTSSGYCWQSDKPVALRSYATFPDALDWRCQEVIRDGGESAWEPLAILAPYFEEKAALDEMGRAEQ